MDKKQKTLFSHLLNISAPSDVFEVWTKNYDLRVFDGSKNSLEEELRKNRLTGIVDMELCSSRLDVRKFEHPDTKSTVHIPYLVIELHWEPDFTLKVKKS